MKKRLVMTIAIASVVVLSGLACAETVTRIAGNRIRVRDSRGNERTIEGTSKGLKVGDRVRLMSRGGRTAARTAKPPGDQTGEPETFGTEQKATGNTGSPTPSIPSGQTETEVTLLRRLPALLVGAVDQERPWRTQKAHLPE